MCKEWGFGNFVEWVRESGVGEVSVSWSQSIIDIFVPLWKDKCGFCGKK